MPTVSKRLGHASVNVTAAIYAHALPNDEAEAAEIWAQGMRAANEPQSNSPQRKLRVVGGRRLA